MHPSHDDQQPDRFHAAVEAWFRRAFPSATEAQEKAWPEIRSQRHTLVAAPTGSGKTLTAFLAAIDHLVREGVELGDDLPPVTTVLYVSPLKALSNDIRLNLEEPLAGIAQELVAMGLRDPHIRVAVRTGDTTAAQRQAMRKNPPHILVTTPESLYVLLGSDSGRHMLSTVRTVIVDEIHAVAASKRGSHLVLSLERLDALCKRRPTRIGLSATQKPLEAVARFLVGQGGGEAIPCAIVDIGHRRRRDLAIEIPPAPLDAVMSNDVWERVYDRIAELVVLHRTTLLFVNTRRLAERVTRHLADRLGKQAVAAHHGSLSKEHRLDAEARLKAGKLQVLVATASLELGIDIGEVDLVCQVGSPRSIATLLQRVGRSGHHIAGVPKGRLFPTSRDDLIECAALLDCIRRGELDSLRIPTAPLDVLAQQIVAEVACQEWREDGLFDLVRRSDPYRELTRESFDAIVRMLTEGTMGRNGVRGAYLHRDSTTGTLRGRRGAKLTAVTSGGTIPDNADYAVRLVPEGLTVGSVNEDFAIESLAGDVFQLGNLSYRILRIEPGRVHVEDARGVAPNIPFWLGEAPGRSDELSFGVGRLYETVDQFLEEEGQARGTESAVRWLGDAGTCEAAAHQIIDYLARSRVALGALPSQKTLVMERFFDESGGMQLVLHSPFGSRINRAWGLALRKRFCRTFNFELQAAASEDAIVLSLSTSHSFPLEEVWRYVHSASAEHLLIQALLDAPLFNVRWRWNATTSLGLPRYSGGRKVAPQLQRMKSDDLLASLFPDQAACLENIVGERDVPEHPLVEQTVADCLHEAMDSEGWLSVLRRMERGEIRLLSRDLPSPSPLAMEILTAKPYAFLDDAPLEERRTQAVLSRRWVDAAAGDDLGMLDANAIAMVREEAWPRPANSDEMHEGLLALSCITESEARRHHDWSDWLQALARRGRAARLVRGPEYTEAIWVPVERMASFAAVFPQATWMDELTIPKEFQTSLAPDQAIIEIVRGRLSGAGPASVDDLARPIGLGLAATRSALANLEVEGVVIRGKFTPGATSEEWCERHLLARIHRYTLKRLRREIEPVEPRDFMRFLFDWQHVSSRTRLSGSDSLSEIVTQLEGFPVAASAWESEVLPARIRDYSGLWLDDLCRSGKTVWSRIARTGNASAGPVRSTPIVLLPRRSQLLWSALAPGIELQELSSHATNAQNLLLRHGAMFFEELLEASGMLRSQLEQALGELVASGLVNADSFAGLRAMLLPAAKRSSLARRARAGRGTSIGIEESGRWAPIRRDDSASSRGALAPNGPKSQRSPELVEHVVRVLLRRYGVVFWRVLEREGSWLPTWREMLPELHRLEARGEIRGGRFVAGFAGEQFALPEAIPMLREVRRRPPDGSLVCISGVDPLNLTGSILPGERVSALVGNKIAFLDGIPVSMLSAGRTHHLTAVPSADEARVRASLLGRRESLYAGAVPT